MNVRPSSDAPRIPAVLAGAAVAGAAVLGIVGALVMARKGQDPLLDELGKDLLQLVVVVGAGALLTAAFTTLQRRRDDRRDVRRQGDELVRTSIGEIIGRYHRIRSARWLLQARVGAGAERCISLEDLDEHLPVVNEARLAFERMHDLCATHDVAPWTDVEQLLKRVQEPLKPLCAEYVKQRQVVAAAGCAGLRDLPQLCHFLDDGPGFEGMCGDVRRIVETMAAHLLRSPEPVRAE